MQHYFLPLQMWLDSLQRGCIHGDRPLDTIADPAKKFTLSSRHHLETVQQSVETSQQSVETSRQNVETSKHFVEGHRHVVEAPSTH